MVFAGSEKNFKVPCYIKIPSQQYFHEHTYLKKVGSVRGGGYRCETH